MNDKPLPPPLSPSDGERENRRQPSNETVVIEMRDVAVSAMRNSSLELAEEVNWTVRAGEFWVVAGPQRSGKSDLLMLAGGLMSPARGAYFFCGEEMPIFEEERLPQRLRLGLVFDGGQLFGHMTLAENVALPLRYHENLSRHDAEPRVQELMDLLELTPLAHNTPASVARNWQKRAGLARALILKPNVLLLDNPLGGLGARHTAWWLNFLEQLSAGHSFMGGRRVTIVATTDNLALWRAQDYLFATINDRKFSTVGGRDELNRSADPVVKELLAVHVAGA